VPGVYCALLTVTPDAPSNCPAVTDTVSFVVFPAATAVITRPVAPQCLTGPTATFNLNGTCSGGTAAWTFTCQPPGSNPSFGTPGSCSTTATVDLPGVYCALLTVTPNSPSNCPAVTDTVSFVVFPSATAVIALPIPSQCLTDATGTFSLNATCSGGTSVWRFTCQPPGSHPTFADSTACSTTASADVPGVYCVRLAVTPGGASTCPGASDTTHFVLSPRPTCAISPVDTTIDAGGTAHLCGPSGNFSYSWSPGGATSQCIDVTSAGTYILTLTDLATTCSSTCQAVVRINEVQRCWLTGGGQSYDASGHLHSYGGVVNPGCSPTAAAGGNWNDVDLTSGAHFQGQSIVVDQCGNVTGIPPGSDSPKTPFNFIEFHGTGTYVATRILGRPVAVSFFGHYEDRREPGSLGQPDSVKKDRYFLRVFTNPADPFGSTVLLVDGDKNSATVDPVAILHGNLQLHITGCNSPAGIFDSPGLGSLETMPHEVSFGLPRPNPTGSSMELQYGLPREAQVSAKVYDVAGRAVHDFGDGALAAGWHTLTWNLQDESGQRVSAGLYFIRLTIDGQTQMRHLTVLR
jgi:hypothetical protein